jgi:hypothetical protein
MTAKKEHSSYRKVTDRGYWVHWLRRIYEASPMAYEEQLLQQSMEPPKTMAEKAQIMHSLDMQGWLSTEQVAELSKIYGEMQ